MKYNKAFFEKVFSNERMSSYFNKYPPDPDRAILHYKCNLELSESMYLSLSVLVAQSDRFPKVSSEICKSLGWP